MRRAPRQDLLPFEFVPDAGDAITSWSGLTLLADLMRRLGLAEPAKRLALRERASGHDEMQLLTAFVLLFAAAVIESSKREALAHYKGGRGYQPVAALWAEADLVLADQFRDGNVPAGMGNTSVIEAALAAVPKGIAEVRLRADSALYEQKVLRLLVARNVQFAISADMGQELRRVCAAAPEKGWSVLERRPDLLVELADVEFSPDDAWPKDAAPLRYIALRFRQAQGALFADGSDTKYFAIVTNREGNAAELVRWHRQKAGTIEHLHDVTKNELGAGTMPSAKLGANAAWYRLNLVTYSLLSLLKKLALDGAMKDARPKRLRLHVFAVAARVTSHARGLFARVMRWAFARLERARAYLAELHPAPA